MWNHHTRSNLTRYLRTFRSRYLVSSNYLLLFSLAWEVLVIKRPLLWPGGSRSSNLPAHPTQLSIYEYTSLSLYLYIPNSYGWHQQISWVIRSWIGCWSHVAFQFSKVSSSWVGRRWGICKRRSKDLVFIYWLPHTITSTFAMTFNSTCAQGYWGSYRCDVDDSLPVVKLRRIGAFSLF